MIRLMNKLSTKEILAFYLLATMCQIVSKMLFLFVCLFVTDATQLLCQDLLRTRKLCQLPLFPKFGGCGSKIEPAMLISILNFSRAWQSYLVCNALQILVNDRSFIGQHMIFLSFFLYLYQET